jgi:AcrR family transcriptional regulator
MMTAVRPERVAGQDVQPTPPGTTREVILDAAELLFSARGMEGVAVRDLARELNLTPSSLYNHFPSKQALYDAVLERGLRPIVEIVAAAWQPGALQPPRIRVTVARLVTHLAAHPHLARLLQRAFLEESDTVRALIERWITPLYGSGMAVIEEAAQDAGWERDELPHLAMGLFSVIFSYFTNAAIFRTLTRARRDLLSSKTLAVQRRFLEKTIYRLLGPYPQRAARGKGRRA